MQRLFEGVSKTRLVLSSLLVASSLLQAYFAAAAWTIDTRAAGAVTALLLLLALISAAGAAAEYRYAVGMAKPNPDREVLYLSALFYLQIFPLAIATGLYDYPITAAAVALLLGLLPVGVYLIREDSRKKTSS